MSTRNLIRAGALATVTTMVTVGLLGFGLAAPAMATEAVFTVSPGALSITVPSDTADLGTVDGSVADQLVSGAFGTVTVIDTRGGSDTTWAVMVSSTPFRTANEAVPASNVDYHATLSRWDGPGASGATVTANPLHGLSAPQPAVAVTGLHGNNAATWTSAIKIRVPANTASGTYSGKITHSVA